MSINALRYPPPPGGPMSVQEYLWLDENVPNAKYEYINDVARLLAGGSVAHDRIARNVAHFIEEQLLTGPCTAFGAEVRVLIDYKASGRQSYVYPDATVSCDVADRRRDNKLIRSPRIVVEVLSPSTEAFDKGEKLEIYKNCPTIQEVVLIDQFEQQVFVYRRDEEDESSWHHTLYSSGSTVELTSIDICLSMAEIYRGIDFSEPLLGH